MFTKLLWRFFIIMLANTFMVAIAATTYYGPTTNKDNLGQIANKVRPDNSVTLPQIMVAILKANPNAFLQANINGLKNGQMLRIPEVSEIQRVDATQAVQMLNQQNRDWQNNIEQNNALLRQINSPYTAKPDIVLPAPGQLLAGHDAAINNDPVKKSNNMQQPVARLSQQLDHRITKLEQQNAFLQSQVTVLGNTIAGLSKQVQEIKNQLPTNKPASFATYNTAKITNYGMQIAFIIIIVLSVVAIWMPWPILIMKLKERLALYKNHHHQDEASTSDDDFTSRLNLAKTYIKRQDLIAAKQILSELQQQGDEAQRQAANELLAQLAKPI